ncbi:MarR family winged helix-turn-helix transcriptional regulator [Verrucomicrobium spinosum]|uniref:MarR family winged helix-turn-helix transcriptional regulator n=1 Tax=Verrucomicrobium spinosum TaxID=2736 RepID=UPI0001745B02|nr:MarR family transcriptional regulator [Verrucomicrobium spinosum]
MSRSNFAVPLARRFGGALNLAQHALRTRLDEALRPLNLTAPQCAVLSALEQEPGLSNAALARAAFVTPQSMQGILVNMEREGFITRSPDPNHGRILRSEITASGRKALTEAHTAILEVEAVAPSLMSEREMERLTKMLTRYAELLMGGESER